MVINNSNPNDSPKQFELAAHGVSMDEDSQETITLPNALQPLPETQVGSPEKERRSSPGQGDDHQLLARPHILDLNLNEGFSWGPSVKITPGQFGRAISAKSRIDATKEMVTTNSPDVQGLRNVDKTISIASGPAQSKSVYGQSGRAISPESRRPAAGEAACKPVLGVKVNSNVVEKHKPIANDSDPLVQVQRSSIHPPFEEYDFEYQHPGTVEQLRATHASPSRQLTHQERSGAVGLQTNGLNHYSEAVPRRENTMSGENKRRSQSILQQQSQSETASHVVQTKRSRHRISLPNDTSVSPAQLPRPLPLYVSQSHVLRENPAPPNPPEVSPRPPVNRPMRDIRHLSTTKTPIQSPSTRSTVHESNISKRRLRNRPTASGRARASRQDASHHYDSTPSVRRHDQLSLTSRYIRSVESCRHANVASEMDSFAGNLAQALNSEIGPIRQEWKRKDQELAYLERHLQKQTSELSEIKKQSKARSGKIQKLEDDRSRLQEQLEAANQQLQHRSVKVSKLEDNCRMYREYLNSATAEQQDLLTAAKAKCDDAIKQMREEERKRKALDEQERKEIQATRERLTQIAKSTVAECNFKERDSNNKIETLKQRLQERDADIERERETTRNLCAQNATIASIQGAIKSFESQIKQVTAKLGEIESRQVERDETEAGETQAKLDTILERLSTLDERTEPQDSIVEKLKEANALSFSSAIKPVLTSHAETQANAQKLYVSVENYMEDFWMKLEDREDVLTELLEQTKTDNAQLETDLQLREEECRSLLKSLTQAETTILQREEDIEKLIFEIAEVEQAQADDLEQAVHAKSLHDECEKLRAEIAAKTAIISDLEGRLQQSKAALLMETEKHRQHTQDLQKLMKQREETAQAAQGAAVEIARKEVTREMNTAKEKFRALLKQSEGERTRLKDHLNEAKQQATTFEELSKRDSTAVGELRSELEMAQAKTTTLGELVKNKDMEIRNAIENHSERVEELQAKVANKEKVVIQLSEDARTYDMQMQKVLDGLKAWAHDRQGEKAFITELEKAQHGVGDSIDPRLKPFLEIDVLHKAIFQYCLAYSKSAQNELGNTEQPIADQDFWVGFLPTSSSEENPPKSIAARILDQVRRVTVKSPLPALAASPIPLSVSAEQEHRRSADPPRSIMKVGTQSTFLRDGGLDEMKISALSLDVPSRGSFGRRTYGRFGAAKKLRQDDGEPQEEHGHGGSISAHAKFTRAPYNRPVEGAHSLVTGDITAKGIRVGREPQKRKQSDHQEAGSPKKRAKIKTEGEITTLLMPKVSPQESQVIHVKEPRHVPSAPRKRSHKNAVNLSESNSPVHSPHFTQGISPGKRADHSGKSLHDEAKDLTLDGHKAFISARAYLNNPQDNSHGSTPIYSQSGRSSQPNEDSQGAITHSPIVMDELARRPVRTRRFTMGP